MESALCTPGLQGGPLFPQLTDTLVSWEKRAESSDQAATFRRLLADFWEGLGRLCVRQADAEEAQEGALQGVASLLRVMQNPTAAVGDKAGRKKTKKAAKIRFADLEAEEGEEGEEPEQGEGRGKGGEEPGPALRGGHLEELVCRLAELAMVYVNQRDSETHLRFLSVLVSSFPSRPLFRALLDPAGEGGQEEEEEELKVVGEEGEALGQNPAVRFLLQKVVVWLQQDRRKDTDFLVNLVFSALRCCSTKEGKTHILDHITKVREPLERCAGMVWP